jgi:hypothetical protein
MSLHTCAFLGNLAGPDMFVFLFVLAPFIVDIIAIVEILKSRADGTTKLLWFLVVWFIPWLGLILYYTIGRESIKSPSA